MEVESTWQLIMARLECLREVRAAQEVVNAVIGTNQSAQAEYEGTISKQTESVLASIEQQAQSLQRELDIEIPGTQLDIQVMKMLI
jgi:hypothetical protein